MKLSPHLGYYKENDIEVILFDEPIDNFLMMNVHDYKKKVGEGDDAEVKYYRFTPVDITEEEKDQKGDKEKIILTLTHKRKKSTLLIFFFTLYA